jgi:hypothetical protein
MSATAVSPIHHQALACQSSIGHAGARSNRAPALFAKPHPAHQHPSCAIKQSQTGFASRRNHPTTHFNSFDARLIANKSP